MSINVQKWDWILPTSFAYTRIHDPCRQYRICLAEKPDTTYKPSVVLTYTAKPNVYASLIAHHLNIPVINNVTGLGSVINETGVKRKIIMVLFKKAYSYSSCIMFQNSTNMQLAQELGWIKGDYKLIPGSGVALDRYPVQEYPEGGNGIHGAPDGEMPVCLLTYSIPLFTRTTLHPVVFLFYSLIT